LRSRIEVFEKPLFYKLVQLEPNHRKISDDVNIMLNSNEKKSCSRIWCLVVTSIFGKLGR
jgi:hypothetical protein